MSLLKVITQKSISGSKPKHPPNVATYTTGTQGLVPSMTRCAPINPKGKGNAKIAETIFFFLFSFAEFFFLGNESVSENLVCKQIVSETEQEIPINMLSFISTEFADVDLTNNIKNKQLGSKTVFFSILIET